MTSASSDPTDTIRQLLMHEVPEIRDGYIHIRSVAREIGYRSKVAVQAMNENLDVIAACVGVRGSRIRKVIEALDGERLDLVRWDEELKVFIANSLLPAKI